MLKTMDSHVIPAEAGIQWCTTGSALPVVGFRVEPGMTESDGVFRFILAGYECRKPKFTREVLLK